MALTDEQRVRLDRRLRLTAEATQLALLRRGPHSERAVRDDVDKA